MKKLYIVLAALFVFTWSYSKDLSGVKIYINPGHGGYNGANDRNVLTIPYALGDTLGFWESWSNLRKGLVLRDRLQAANATVYISRTQNRDEDDRSLSEIAEEANANNVDAFLSIHSNAIGVNSGTNFLLLLYHGYDNPTSGDPTDSLAVLSKGQAQAGWSRLIANPLTVWTSYSASATNIRGDFSFYGNSSGLGVLRPLTVPGFLSEGSFHDYKPETHRLLNEDYRRLEGERFYRYFCDYFQADLPATGIISGWVKGKDQRLNHPNFVYKAATDDQWLPLNGAKVKLMNEAGDSLNSYTVDTLYNGIYAFHDLAPGTYKLRYTAASHQTKDTTVTVTAATETAMKILLFNPDLPLYKEIPPDYPNPVQDSGVIPMSNYNFAQTGESDLSWLNGAAVRKTIFRNDKLYVLTEEPKIHVVNANTFAPIKELDLTGIAGGVKILSDINFTSDGYLLAINKDTISLPEVKGRFMKVYTWDNDDAAPRVLYTSTYQGQWLHGVVGETFAVSGARWKHTLYVPAVTTGSSKQVRIMGLLYEDQVPLGYKYMLDATNYTEGNWGQKIKFTLSPNGSDKIIIDGENILPTEYKFDWSKADRDPLYDKKAFAEVKGYQIETIAGGSNYFRHAGHVYMAAPNSNADNSSAGVVLFDITDGLNNAKKVSEFLPGSGLGTMPAPYMFAAGFAKGYDLDLIVLAENQGVQRYKTQAPTNANVFASELRAEQVEDGYKLHFTLNDNISSGQIDISDANGVVKSIPLTGLSKGQNSIDVMISDLSEGEFTWTVIVNSSAVDRPYKYTNNSWPQLQFYSPRGVAVDNSFESPYFGRVYASETVGGKVTNRTTKDGIYILNAAMEDVTGQGADSYTGDAGWVGTNSPMRLNVAPDGKVYLTDFSATHPGVWIMDPANPSATFKPVFTSDTTLTSGLVKNKSTGVAIHGQIPHCYVLGTGAETKLFTFDSRYVDAVAIDNGNLLQYNIGNLETPWDKAPSAIVYNDGVNGNLQLNFNSSIAPDGKGGWWISQYRDTDAAGVPSLIHVNTSGIVDFNSGKTPTLIGNSYTGGMAVTEDGTRLAMGSRDEVKIYDVTFSETGVPSLLQKYSIKPALGTNTAGLAFDKAGNVYVISNSSERMGVWALPKSENTFTTPAPTSQMIVVVKTGLQNVKGKAEISVYPNPVTDLLNLKSSKVNIISIEIYDINGKLIMNQMINANEKELNVSELVSGAYILRIKHDKGIESVRILKK